jgi:hypothetical protein
MVHKLKEIVQFYFHLSQQQQQKKKPQSFSSPEQKAQVVRLSVHLSVRLLHF